MDIKTEINKLFTPEQKASFQSLLKKFNLGAAPIANPLTPVAPAVAPAAPVSLQESPLEDGTVLKYDTPTLAAGSVVTVVGPEGELPAPTGELKLKDGTVITVVNQEGKSVVETVTPGAMPMEPAAPVMQVQAPIAPQLAAMQSEFEQKFTAVNKEKEELKKELAQSKEVFTSQVNDLKKDVGAFMEMFAPFLDIPSAEPIEVPKNKFAKAVDLKADKLSKFKTQ
jgi:hypothetical protein